MYKLDEPDGKHVKSNLLTELKRTSLSVWFFVFVMWLNSVVQAVGDTRFNEHFKSQPVVLVDLGFEVVARPEGFPKWAADVALISFVLLSFTSWLVSNSYRFGLKSGCAVTLSMMRRIFWLCGTCALFRAICLLGTTLPPSNSECKVKSYTFSEALRVGAEVLLGLGQTCTDKIFSGHTSMATIFTWCWVIYGTQSGKLYGIVHGNSVWIASLMYRHHYTVDISVAIVVASLVFHLYHCCLCFWWNSKNSPKEKDIEIGLTECPMIGNPTLNAKYFSWLGSLCNVIAWMDGLDIIK